MCFGTTKKKKSLILCYFSWLNTKNMVSKSMLIREVTSSRFHGYLLSFAFLSNIRGNHILTRQVVFSDFLQIYLSQLLCLFLRILVSSFKFSFQLHCPNMESSTIPSLYKFTFMYLALTTTTIFNSSPFLQYCPRSS